MYSKDEWERYVKELDEFLELIDFEEIQGGFLLKVRYTKKEVLCPCCRYTTVRVSSKYSRCFQDLPIQNKTVSIQIMVRKMLCYNPFCSSIVFMENFTFLARNSRKSKRLEAKIAETFLKYGITKSEEMLKEEGVSITRRTIYQVMNRWMKEQKKVVDTKN